MRRPAPPPSSSRPLWPGTPPAAEGVSCGLTAPRGGLRRASSRAETPLLTTARARPPRGPSSRGAPLQRQQAARRTTSRESRLHFRALGLEVLGRNAGPVTPLLQVLAHALLLRSYLRSLRSAGHEGEGGGWPAVREGGDLLASAAIADNLCVGGRAHVRVNCYGGPAPGPLQRVPAVALAAP